MGGGLRPPAYGEFEMASDVRKQVKKELEMKNNARNPRNQAMVGGDMWAQVDDITYGLNQNEPTPQGPIHGEASSANASIGKPRQRTRSMTRAAKGRQPGFTGG